MERSEARTELSYPACTDVAPAMVVGNDDEDIWQFHENGYANNLRLAVVLSWRTPGQPRVAFKINQENIAFDAFYAPDPQLSHFSF